MTADATMKNVSLGTGSPATHEIANAMNGNVCEDRLTRDSTKVAPRSCAHAPHIRDCAHTP